MAMACGSPLATRRREAIDERLEVGEQRLAHEVVVAVGERRVEVERRLERAGAEARRRHSGAPRRRAGSPARRSRGGRPRLGWLTAASLPCDLARREPPVRWPDGRHRAGRPADSTGRASERYAGRPPGERYADGRSEAPGAGARGPLLRATTAARRRRAVRLMLLVGGAPRLDRRAAVRRGRHRRGRRARAGPGGRARADGAPGAHPQRRSCGSPSRSRSARLRRRGRHVAARPAEGGDARPVDYLLDDVRAAHPGRGRSSRRSAPRGAPAPGRSRADGRGSTRSASAARARPTTRGSSASSTTGGAAAR